MPESKGRPPAVSRRAVIGGAACAPAAAVLPAGSGPPTAEDVAARCAEWLALDSEIDRLSLRWTRLEAQAVREFRWFELTSAERRALPMAAEMDEIEGRLDALSEVRAKGLTALQRIRAADLHGAAGKLVVAARLTRHDGGEAHGFIVEAVGALAAVKCPACGVPTLVPFGGGPGALKV